MKKLVRLAAICIAICVLVTGPRPIHSQSLEALDQVHSTYMEVTHGKPYVIVRINGKGKYDQGNRPYIDFNTVVAGTEKQRRFVADDRAVANIIIGDPNKQRPAPDTDWGHVHLESSEFWFILLGKMEYKIGSLPICFSSWSC